MIDVGCCWDWKTAVRREEMLREFEPFWIEEPIAAEDVGGYAELAKHSPPESRPAKANPACRHWPA